MRRVAVILSGGIGERLFPLSTNSKPKQFLNLYNDKIILLGVKPIYPSTQFGYIKLSNSSEEIRKVEAFTEKPSLDMAKEYLKNNFLWNSGTFIFTTKTLLNEFNLYLPEYIKYFNNYFVYKTISISQLVNLLKPISIDKGIIEKSENILCIKLNAGWMDIGNYDNLDSVLNRDDNNNTLTSNVSYIDSNNCMVIGNKEKVILLDVQDLIVSINDGKILIMKKTSDVLKLRRTK